MWPEMVASVSHRLRLPNNSVLLSKATYLFINHLPCPVTDDPLYTLVLVFLTVPSQDIVLVCTWLRLGYLNCNNSV